MTGEFRYLAAQRLLALSSVSSQNETENIKEEKLGGIAKILNPQRFCGEILQVS